MNNNMLWFWLRSATLTALLLGASFGETRADDLNILTIGDSLTRGNRTGVGPDLATYRPYLWQTARNYLDNFPGGSQGVDINFIGTEGNTSVTPVFPSQSVIPISPNWDKNHQGFGGATSLSLSSLGSPNRPNARFIGNVLNRLYNAGTVPDVALILLGTNDLAVLGNQSTSTSFSFNRLDPLDAVSSIETVSTILRDGYNSNNDPEYNGQFGDQFIVSGNPDIRVLIAAVPPVPELQRYSGGGPLDLVPDVENRLPNVPVNTFIWTENDRETIVDTNFFPTLFEQDFVTETGGGGQFGSPFERSIGTPNPDGSQSVDADSNDVIGVMNDMLEDLANDPSKDPGDNWSFVNPFEATQLVDGVGNSVDVDNGGTFDVGGTGRGIWDPDLNGGAGGFATQPNADLADGLHLSFSGDQYYAGNFWDAPGGVRSILFDAVNAASVNVGDFNSDGLLDAADIDLLSGSIGRTDGSFDLTGDGVVDAADREFWIEDLKGSHFGDADLNQSVEFADFLALANGFGGSGGWAEGDFDGSGDVAFADFLMLANNFETSTGLMAAGVPEPSALLMIVFGAMGLAGFRRQKNLTA